MNWLVHHEFGLNQKTFMFNDASIIEKMRLLNKNDINFWLLTWMNYYKYIIHNHPINSLFFCYEVFCENTYDVLKCLFNKLNVNYKEISIAPFEMKAETNNSLDTELLSECNELYRDMKGKFYNWFK